MNTLGPLEEAQPSSEETNEQLYLDVVEKLVEMGYPREQVGGICWLDT